MNRNDANQKRMQVEKLLLELHEQLEEAALVDLPIEELAAWKLLAHLLKATVKESAESTGGFLHKIDSSLVRKMVDAELETLDVGSYRLYADIKGHFDADPFQLDDDLCERKVNKKVLDARCEELLKEGKPLPSGVRSFLQPTVRVRKR